MLANGGFWNGFHWMMQMCCRTRDKKEGAPQGTQETPTSEQ